MLAPSSGSQHDCVILLEDHTVTRSLAWHGPDTPFFAPKTEITVPASGVIRISDLSMVAGRQVNAQWTDGYVSRGMASGPAPDGLNANLYMAFSRNKDVFTDVDDLPIDKTALAQLIREREASN